MIETPETPQSAMVWSYKLVPTPSQREALTAMCETLRLLYNRALAEKVRVEKQLCEAGLKTRTMVPKKDGTLVEELKWVSEGAKKEAKPFYDEVSLGEQNKRLITQERAGGPNAAYLLAVGTGPCQQTLMTLDKAMKAFFRRCKAGESPGFPKFKRYGNWNTINFNIIGQSCQIDLTKKRVYVQHVGQIKLNQYRPMPEGALIKNLSLTRKASGWYVNILLYVTDTCAVPMENPDVVVAILPGLQPLLNIMVGGNATPDKLASPEFYLKAQQGLAERQRRLDRRKPLPGQRGSNGYQEAKQLLARRSLAKRLCEDADCIVRPKLRVSDLVKRATPKEDTTHPGTWLANNAEYISEINKKIHDNAWSMLYREIDRVAKQKGVRIIELSGVEWTQQCSCCGASQPQKSLLETYLCAFCGQQYGTQNTLQNLLQAGMQSVAVVV
jgi:putative transposase